MSDPERIWANAQEWPRGTGRIEVYASATPDPDEPSSEYISADTVAEMIRQAVEQEREACAKVAHDWQSETGTDIAAAARVCPQIAAAIRERGDA